MKRQEEKVPKKKGPVKKQKTFDSVIAIPSLQGKEYVETLIREEKEAVLNLSTLEKKKKSPPLVPLTSTSTTSVATTKLSLTVDASMPTPAVQEAEAHGAGVKFIVGPGEFKKVTKGKNASKGRGAVAPQHRVASNPEPMKKFVPKSQRWVEDEDGNGHLSDEDDVLDISAFPKMDIGPTTLLDSNHMKCDGIEDEGEGEEDDDLAYDPEPTVVTKTANKDLVAQIVKQDDGVVVGKPRYVDDGWAFSTVKALRKRMARHNPKEVPAFYYRRDRDPEEFLMHEGQNQTMPGVLLDAETKGKILTFNADGSFDWPKSSKHLCWNCCHPFEGPPAMIPRYYNRVYKFYEVYGNFCNWPCAKRFMRNNEEEEYGSEMAPSIDSFARNYFGVKGPIPTAPSRILLESFSSFGLKIEDYRKVGVVNEDQSYVIAPGYKMMTPPSVPFEMLVMWKNSVPVEAAAKKGYAKDIKERFENQMRSKLGKDAPGKGPVTLPGGGGRSGPNTGNEPTLTGKKSKKKGKNILMLLQ